MDPLTVPLALPTDDRFRDVGDSPRDGRPDPYGDT